MFRAFSSHRQHSASLIIRIPQPDKTLAKLDKLHSRYDFPGVDHEGRQTFWLQNFNLDFL